MMPHTPCSRPEQLKPGVAIVLEFACTLFFGVIDDSSRLESADELEVTFYHASDPKFSPLFPTQVRLRGVFDSLRTSQLRLADAAQWLLTKAAAA